ncbi:hypothetical protein BFJ68_g15365 [Fusarium oxysporum]|uniref:PD-(D/E)XK nuclease-like domain-containing protein n=1 Tax=Fusarium oxysporum TaxID=5507 RepID=A0A420PN05_FUSOX|nr:hypothetical protein BFJ68_g15365 [Fusarium oxysporum]
MPFILAVITQGSRWHFVLSTRRGQQTILWKEQQFGRTSSAVETYQVVDELRKLPAWAEKVYLPSLVAGPVTITVLYFASQLLGALRN